MTDFHVLPVQDLVEHVTSDECVCGPRIQSVTRLDGSIAWLVIHHSLDNRETTECSRPCAPDRDECTDQTPCHGCGGAA